MAVFRGMDGLVSLGGIISTGTPQTKGAQTAGASSATLDGGGAALNGVVLLGDKFTVAGQATVHTVVTGGAIGAVDANEVAITFTPNVPAGGWADNAVATFATNAVARLRSWSAKFNRLREDKSVFGDASKSYMMLQTDWSGSARGFFDYGDPRQKKVIDESIAASPATVGLVLVMSPKKQIYGTAVVERFNVETAQPSLVTAAFDFQGTTPPAIDWH